METKIAPIIFDSAKRFSIDPKLVAAIIYQESRGYPFSVRYEHRFFFRYIATQIKRLLGYTPTKYGITNATERRLRAFSFGYMQIMGQTAREYGFKGESLLELIQPKENISLGCMILAELFVKYGTVEQVLLKWNGGSDKNYPSRVLSHIHSGEADLLLI